MFKSKTWMYICSYILILAPGLRNTKGNSGELEKTSFSVLKNGTPKANSREQDYNKWTVIP